MKCISCGCYMKVEEGCSWVCVPESELSFEENEFQCKKCTENYGRPITKQNVNLDVCTGIVDKYFLGLN